MLVTCSIGCMSHQSLILYIVAINIYNITRSNRGTGDPLHMDDILIHARMKEELEDRTKQVLERLKNNDLYLKPEKCKFAQREVEFLGMIVTENTIKMDPIKLAGIRDWPTPTTVKQVRSFLGFGNYYRK